MTTKPDPRAPLRTLRHLFTPPVHVLDERASLADLADTFAADARSCTAYLAGPHRRFEGAVPFRALRSALHPKAGARFPGLAGWVQRAWKLPATHARDLVVRTEGATLDTPIREALFEMDLRRLTDLPIMDERGVVVLEITHGAHARILADLP